jgi:hypothetical protein
MKINTEQYNELVEKLGEELAVDVFEKEASGTGDFFRAGKSLAGAEKEHFRTGRALSKAEHGFAKAERQISEKVNKINSKGPISSDLDREVRRETKKQREDASKAVGMATLPHIETGAKVRAAKADVKAAAPGAAKEVGLAAAIGGSAVGGGYALGHHDKAAELLADEMLKEAGFPGSVKKRIGTQVDVAKANIAANKGEKKINKMVNKFKEGPMNDELEREINRKAYFARMENSKQVNMAGAKNFEAKQALRAENQKIKDAAPGVAKKVGIGAGAGALATGGGYALGHRDHAKAAAEALIEGLLYKKAAESDMFDADIVAEASERALNMYGYSRIAE